MPRLTIELDPDDFRALQQRAADAHRDVKSQAVVEIEHSIVETYRSAAPAAPLTEHKSGAPGEPCKAPGAPEKGKP